MARPSITIEAAFGSTWQTSSPSWTNITSYVLDEYEVQWSSGRGRDSDSPAAGTAKFTVRNRDDRFTPGYTGGPYGANVVPLTPVRIRATYNSVTYDCWRGFVREWEPNWDSPSQPTVTVDCVDGLRVLANTKVDSPFRTALLATNPTYYWPLDGTDFLNSSITHDLGPDRLYGDLTYSSSKPGDGSPVRPGGAYGSWDLGDGSDGASVHSHYSTTSIVGTANFTVGLWWHRDGHDITGADRKFFQQSNSSSNYVIVYASTGSAKYGFDIWNGTTLQRVLSASANPNFAYEPQFICVTRNGSTLIMYINGVAEGSLVGSALSVSSADQYFGTDPLQPTQPLMGRISDCWLHKNAALTGAEIADLYAAGIGWRNDIPSVRVGRVLDQIGWPSALRDLDPTNPDPASGATVTALTEQTAALDLITDCVTADDGDVHINGAGEVCYRDGHSRAVDWRSTLAMTLPSGWWPLNETSGTTANTRHPEVWGPLVDMDLVGINSGGNGTYTGSPTLNQTSMLLTGDTVYDKSASFNGSSQYVTIANSTQLQGLNGFTVGAWVQPTNFSAERPIIAKSDASTADFWLTIGTDGRLRCGYVQQTPATREATVVAPMTAGGVYMAIGWYDWVRGEVGAAYVDAAGNVESALAPGLPSDVIRTSTRALWIGRRQNAYMLGKLQHAFMSPRLGSPQLAYGFWRGAHIDLTWAASASTPYLASSWAFEEQRIRNHQKLSIRAQPEIGLPSFEMELTDSTSIGKYGEREDEVSDVPLMYIFPGPPLTRRLLARKATPKLRCTHLDLQGDLSGASLWPLIFNTALGQRLRVSLGTYAANTVAGVGYADWIEHRMSRERWDVSVQLSAF